MRSSLPNKRIVAQENLSVVKVCDCGVLHVSVGPITFRIQREAADCLLDTLGNALRNLETPKQAKRHWVS
jgi:hypothetical protein